MTCEHGFYIFFFFFFFRGLSFPSDRVHSFGSFVAAGERIR